MDHATGQVLTGSFMDYAMPRADNVPMIGFDTEPVPSTTNVMGMKGCGEAGTVGAMAATANALETAAGTSKDVSFDWSEPAGQYTLHLRDPYDHTIACELCELAQRNGEKMMDTAQIQENCSPKGDGIWLERNEIGPGYSRACADRMRLAAMTSFMAVERWADRDMCADDLDYAVVVRDPIDRIVSNTIFTQSSAAGGPGCIEEAYPYEKCTGDAIVGWVAPGAEVSLHAPEALRRCDLIERSTAGYDNFYVRSLVGPDAFTLPAGSLTREHLTKAKKRLSKYAAIIVLDSFDEQSAQLAHILGWRTLDLGDVANSKQSHGLGSAPPPFTDAQLAQLAEANALDYELYCFAQQLAAARTGESLARLARYDTYNRAPRG